MKQKTLDRKRLAKKIGKVHFSAYTKPLAKHARYCAERDKCLAGMDVGGQLVTLPMPKGPCTTPKDPKLLFGVFGDELLNDILEPDVYQ